MKYFLSIIAAVFFCQSAHSQMVITEADMPVAGDMLCYSNAPITGTNFSPADSGANIGWVYNLSSTSQGVDTYKTAFQVSPIYAATISSSATGYKTGNNLPGLSMLPAAIPINISDIYTFFEHTTTPQPIYAATAIGYKLNGTLPLAAKYDVPDEWYHFPLAYGNSTDSTRFSVNIDLMGTVGLKQTGYRLTRVDAYGAIITPYFTAGVACIRVRTEIHEIDSITVSGFSFGLPRNTVEYKWLANGEHYPALWITSTLNGGNETINTVRYRDSLPVTPERIVNETPAICEITAFPNPAANGIVTLGLPAAWKTFQVEVFDIQAKQVAVVNNQRKINLQAFPSGQYLVRITSGSSTGYARITR